MDTDNHFIIRKPFNQFLSTLVDYYFHIDIPVNQLSLNEEYIIPFPRITFGYFFNHPFIATNHTLNQSVSVNMAISRISTHKIVVQPQSDRVKIIGAHVRPFCLAYLTEQPIHTMSWLINMVDLFGKAATDFEQRIERCSEAEQMFSEVEKMFLDNTLVRDLSLITSVIELIDKSAGNIQLKKLSAQLGVSDRTIRNHFYDHIGCSPKEYIRLVKLKQVAYQMKNSSNTLTSIAYDNDYFDQAHFIHEVKNVTGRSPNELRKEIPHFRFLQF
jgi:AraC-like DNA-binding protein